MMPIQDNGNDAESVEVEYGSDSIHSVGSNNSEDITFRRPDTGDSYDHVVAEMTSWGGELSIPSAVESFNAEPACRFLDSHLMPETAARTLHFRSEYSLVWPSGDLSSLTKIFCIDLRSSIDQSRNALLYPPITNVATKSSLGQQKVTKRQENESDCGSKNKDAEISVARLMGSQHFIQARYAAFMILVTVVVGSVLLLIPFGTTLSFIANSSLALLFATFGLSLLLVILLFATVE